MLTWYLAEGMVVLFSATAELIACYSDPFMSMEKKPPQYPTETTIPHAIDR